MKRRMKMPQEESPELGSTAQSVAGLLPPERVSAATKGCKWSPRKETTEPTKKRSYVPQPENHSCPVYQQPFPSEKALYGHMRKHPYRGWRGMNPPAPAEENPLAIVPVAAADELVAPAEDRPIPNRLGSGNGFLCDACGRAFKSYHALGGHKSHHGRYNKAVYMGEVGGSVGGGVEERRRRECPLGFAFDLNELPPESSAHGGV